MLDADPCTICAKAKIYNVDDALTGTTKAGKSSPAPSILVHNQGRSHRTRYSDAFIGFQAMLVGMGNISFRCQEVQLEA